MCFAKGSVNLTQEGVNYRENNATGGGGIYATGSINVKSVGGEFLKNFATEKGGAIVFDTVSRSRANQTVLNLNNTFQQYSYETGFESVDFPMDSL